MLEGGDGRDGLELADADELGARQGAARGEADARDGRTGPEDLDRVVRERWDFHDDQFLSTLRSAASARYHPDLPQSQALKIVQSLYEYAVKLKLFPVPDKEKH